MLSGMLSVSVRPTYFFLVFAQLNFIGYTDDMILIRMRLLTFQNTEMNDWQVGTASTSVYLYHSAAHVIIEREGYTYKMETIQTATHRHTHT